MYKKALIAALISCMTVSASKIAASAAQSSVRYGRRENIGRFILYPPI